MAPRKDKLQSLEDRTKRLSGVLRNAVLEMMLQWASQARANRASDSGGALKPFCNWPFHLPARP